MFGKWKEEASRLEEQLEFDRRHYSGLGNTIDALREALEKYEGTRLRDYTVCWDDETSDTHRADNLTHLAEGSVVVFWQGGVKTGIVRDYVSIDSKPVKDDLPEWDE